MNIVQNTTEVIAFECLSNGTPFDLTSASEIEISLKQDISGVLKTHLLSDSEVNITGDDNEICYAAFTPTETLAFLAGFAKAQCRIKDASGTVIGNVARMVVVSPCNSTEAL